MKISISENIKRLRREKYITQEVLADFLGVSFQSVSKWERGEAYPDITFLPGIADYFGVTVGFLLGSEKEQNMMNNIEKADKILTERDIKPLIIHLPKCKTITSGNIWWDDLWKEGGFNEWARANPHLYGEGFFGNPFFHPEWTCVVDEENEEEFDMATLSIVVRDNVTKEDAGGYELDEFPGGLYAMLYGGFCDEEFGDEMMWVIRKWIDANTKFEYDETRRFVSQILYGEGHPEIKEGYGNMQYARSVPIRLNGT